MPQALFPDPGPDDAEPEARKNGTPDVLLSGHALGQRGCVEGGRVDRGGPVAGERAETSQR
jgi:hypothetical protein